MLLSQCDELRQAITDGAQLVDVRSPQEHAAGALPQSINLPLQQVGVAHEFLDPAKPVLVYCGSGQRSEMACQALGAMGYEQVQNIGGHNTYKHCA